MNNLEIEIFDTTRVILKKDYNLLDNKPQINSVELSGNKTLNELGIATKTSDLVNDSGFISTETDPTVPNYVKNIKEQDINNWNNKSEFSGDYNDLTNKPTIPSKTSDLVNDSNYVSKGVDDLINYYKKSETYTQEEVNNLIGTISGINIEIVQVLPTQDISTYTIYLVPKTASETNNIYDEYIYVSNNWEKIGDTEIDLSNYQPLIDNSHKLSADLVDDTNTTNKFFSGNYNDLSNKPTIPTVPTNISAFTNDVGYLTQHQDISGKLDTSKVKNEYSTTAGDVYDVRYINAMIGDIESLLSEV